MTQSYPDLTGFAASGVARITTVNVIGRTVHRTEPHPPPALDGDSTGSGAIRHRGAGSIRGTALSILWVRLQ